MVWTIVLSPLVIQKLSWVTLVMGIKQLMVKEGLLMLLSELYILWLMPFTNIGASAEIMTFSTPPFEWAVAFSLIIKIRQHQHHPVDVGSSHSWKMEVAFLSTKSSHSQP